MRLKICSNDLPIKNYLEETIKTRLRTDINDSFSVNLFVFNDKYSTELNKFQDFLDYVTKLSESMSIINEYQKIFALFDVNYIKICFFETNNAADRVKLIFILIKKYIFLYI